METKYDDEGEEIEALTRRSRRRTRQKAKSVVGLRLNPNFDLKESLLQNSCTANQQTLKIAANVLSPDELDPKTMDFDSLAELLHPSFICDYLQKVLRFLKSNQSELQLPDLAPYKEAFMVKISKEPRNLMSRTFNEASASVGRQIIDVLNQNKDVYMWVHCFKCGKDFKDVLFYRKLEVKKPHNVISHRTFPPQTTHPYHKNVSRETQEISASFRINMLNTTLKFVKDASQSSLEYPVMTPAQADFIYSLVNHNDHNGEIGLGFKSLYASLYELLKKIGEVYKFVVTSVSTGRSDEIKLVLQKIPRDAGRRNENGLVKKSPDKTTSTTLTKPTKLQKETALKHQMLEGLSQTFIQRSLEDFLDFLEDKYRASIEFQQVDVRQARFLESIISISRNLDHYEEFGADSVIALKRIARSVRREPWRLNTQIGRLCKRTEKRSVIFSKEPTYEMAPVSAARESPQKTKPMEINTDQPKTTKPITPPNNTRPEVSYNFSITSGNGERQVKRSVSLERKPRLKGGIAFQSAGEHVEEREVANDDVTPKRWSSMGRRGKLIEALSTPLESTIGEKLMRLAGWDGGALGLRGEGIKEPLMPALHLSAGAGLGYIKQTNHSVAEFREKFLSSLLSFLHSDSTDTSVSFAQPLTKREGRFLTPTISAINQRKHIGLSRTEETNLLKSISEIMMREDQLQIAFEVMAGKRELRLTKKQGASITAKASKRKKKKSKLDPNNSVTVLPVPTTDNKEVITPDQVYSLNTTYDLENTCPTSKAAKSLAYRILFLDKIRDFLKMEDNIAEFKFDCVLNTKQRNYIQGIITDVNKKVSRGKHSDLENEIYMEIRKIAGDCYMNVVFSGQKFILEKKYYQKRFTNSALGLPPLISKDVKNTIIYTPNGVIRDESSVGDDETAMRSSHHEEKDVDSKMLDTTIRDNDESEICDDEEKNYSENVINIDNSNEDCAEISICDYEEAVSAESGNDSILVLNGEDKTIISDDDVDMILPTDKNGEECDDDLMETDFETAKDYTSLDISNESLLLNVLEQENDKCVASGNADTESDKVTENDLESMLDDFTEKYLSDVKIEMNNNCDKIDWNENTQSIEIENVDVSSKSNISEVSHPVNCETSNSNFKVVYVSIVSKSYDKISVDLVKQVQKLISESIDENEFLPLLKCHGVRNGELVYSCHSEKSFDWLKSVLSVASVEMIPTDFGNCRLIMKVGSYISVDIESLLKRIKVYNTSLNTDNWQVAIEKVYEDCVIYSVALGENCFNYITVNNFSLFAGVDKVEFSITWD